MIWGDSAVPRRSREPSERLSNPERFSPLGYYIPGEGQGESIPFPRANFTPGFQEHSTQDSGRFACQQEVSLPPRHYYWSRLDLGIWLGPLPSTPCQRLQVLAAALALSMEQERVRKYYMDIFSAEDGKYVNVPICLINVLPYRRVRAG